MLFVAITRVTSPEGLTILCDPNLMVEASGAGEEPVSSNVQRYATTRNVVHERSYRTGTDCTDHGAAHAANSRGGRGEPGD